MTESFHSENSAPIISTLIPRPTKIRISWRPERFSCIILSAIHPSSIKIQIIVLKISIVQKNLKLRFNMAQHERTLTNPDIFNVY